MSVDKYLDAVYKDRVYTCLHFADDVWFGEKGFRLNAELFKYLNGGVPNVGMRKSFERLVKPISPCLVVFKESNGQTHIGVFIRNGILHLPRTGAQFQPLEVVSLGFKSVRFFDVNRTNNC